MRISDRSSDVCSSDLGLRPLAAVGESHQRQHVVGVRIAIDRAAECDHAAHALRLVSRHLTHEHAAERSEEHTSELQSLMRISYAVFCLKKKKKYNHNNKNNTPNNVLPTNKYIT